MSDKWSVNGVTGVGPAIVNERGETVGAMWTLADAEKVVADHNALAGIADPAAFMAAVRELVAGQRRWREERQPYATLQAADKIIALLPPETP